MRKLVFAKAHSLLCPIKVSGQGRFYIFPSSVAFPSRDYRVRTLKPKLGTTVFFIKIIMLRREAFCGHGGFCAEWSLRIPMLITTFHRLWSVKELEFVMRKNNQIKRYKNVCRVIPCPLESKNLFFRLLSKLEA